MRDTTLLASSLPSLDLDLLAGVTGGCKKKAACPPPPPAAPADTGSSVDVEVSTGVQAGASQAPQLL